MSNLIDKIPLVIRAALARAAWTFVVVLVPALGTGAATDLDYLAAANIALGAAVLSFAKSLIVGMPETQPVESTLDALIGLAHNQGVSLSSAATDEDAVAALIAYKPKVTRKTA